MRTNDKGGWPIVKPKAIVGLQLKISNQQTFNSLDVGILFMFVCVHSNRETGPGPYFAGAREAREVGSRMTAFSAIIDELETAVQSRSDGRRVEILRQVTDLFLGGAPQFNDGQVELFDGVLAQLTQRVESNVLAELSAKLSPVANAPNGVIQSLARHDAIVVAGPVLSNSPRLTDGDLIEIASTKGQGHLGAISGRSRLAEAVTDVLVERGDGEVLNKLTRNEGAAFSAGGFSTLAKRAEDDGRLAENLGMRLDVPPQLLQELIAKAAEDVQRRLLDNAPPASQFIIRDALAHVASKVMRQAAAPRDFSRAEAVIEKMQAGAKTDRDRDPGLCQCRPARRGDRRAGAPVRGADRPGGAADAKCAA